MIVFAVGRRVMIVSLLGLLVASGGCRSGPIAIDGDRLERLEIADRDPVEGRFRLYEVEGDGTFRVGAGARARLGETVAAPSLDDADLQRLHDSMCQAGWIDASPPASTGSGPRRLEVAMHLDGMVRRFELLGDGRRFDARTAVVLAELEGFAARRFGGVLDALPKGR